MQRFRFRLQRVLHWQERVCRLEEEKLRQCLWDVAESEGKLERWADQRVAIEHEFSTQSRLSAPDLQALAAFRRSAITERQALEKEREARMAALAVQREHLLGERRKLHVIEKLRDRALEEYNRAADKEAEALSQESYLATWLSRS